MYTVFPVVARRRKDEVVSNITHGKYKTLEGLVTILRAEADRLEKEIQEFKNMNSWEPQLGDYVYTTQIGGCSDGEETARVRKVYREENQVSVIYGGYSDWATVDIESCTFVCHGEISESEIENISFF